MNVPVEPVFFFPAIDYLNAVGFGDIVEYQLSSCVVSICCLPSSITLLSLSFLFVASCESECREEQKSCLSYLYFHCLTLSVWMLIGFIGLVPGARADWRQDLFEWLLVGIWSTFLGSSFPAGSSRNSSTSVLRPNGNAVCRTSADPPDRILSAGNQGRVSPWPAVLVSTRRKEYRYYNCRCL